MAEDIAQDAFIIWNEWPDQINKTAAAVRFAFKRTMRQNAKTRLESLPSDLDAIAPAPLDYDLFGSYSALARALVAHNLNQYQTAQALGVSEPTISREFAKLRESMKDLDGFLR